MPSSATIVAWAPLREYRRLSPALRTSSLKPRSANIVAWAPLREYRRLSPTWRLTPAFRGCHRSDTVASTPLPRAVVAEKVATGDIDWEQAAIENTASSWKDEFALVALMAPAVAVYFVPDKVQEGFAILATLPDWYQYLLFIAISSSFGIKGVGQAAKMLAKRR